MTQGLIETKLHMAFNPEHLQVINESYMHNVPPGSQSHFKVIVVSELFEGQTLIQRHRAVNQVLADELAERIHALSMHTYTPAEWRTLRDGAPASPKCLGGENSTT